MDLRKPEVERTFYYLPLLIGATSTDEPPSPATEILLTDPAASFGTAQSETRVRATGVSPPGFCTTRLLGKELDETNETFPKGSKLGYRSTS